MAQEDEATLCFDSRPVYTLWRQTCRHGDLFIVQSEGGELTASTMAGGSAYLLNAMSTSSSFVTMYDLTSGLTGFVQCAPALLELATKLRSSASGKQKAVLIISSSEAVRSWTRWFVRIIPREGVSAHILTTVEEAWQLLEQENFLGQPEAVVQEAEELQEWVDLMSST